MKFNSEAINKWAAKKLFSSDDRRSIWLKLAKLLENGVPILKATESIRDRRVKAKGESDFAVLAMKEWVARMRNGSKFSEAIVGWAPHQEIMLISAGDRSGDLQSALLTSSGVMMTIKKIRGAVIAGVLYPLILSIMAITVAYLFGTKIFPQFFKIASEDKWQGFATYAISFSHFVQDWLWLVGVIVVLVTVLFFYSLSRWDGPVRKKLDTMMPYSLYRVIIGSSWLVSVAAMINAGERIEDALLSMKKGAGKWLSNRIDSCLRYMRQGHNMGDALQKTGNGFPDPEIIEDLGVYATVSGFDEALQTLGKEWSVDAVEKIELQSKILFTVGILFVACLLGFLIAGLMSMQLQLGDVIRAR